MPGLRHGALGYLQDRVIAGGNVGRGK